MKKMILACGAALSIATMANATLIRYVAEWDMVKTDGLDSLGLDGAHFVFTADFDSADVYGDNGFGFPQANASADSLTITGSTGGDGTYSSLFGVAFTPATPGQWKSLPPGGGLEFLLANDQNLIGQRFVDDTNGLGANVGDTIDPSHFGLTPDPDNPYWIIAPPDDQTSFAMENFNASVIPAPGAVATLGIACLVAGRRRRG